MRRTLLAAVAAICLTLPAMAADAPGKDVLARMEGKEITRKDLNVLMKKLPEGAQSLPAAVLEPMVLDQLINDELLLKAANEEKVSDGKEYQKRLAELQEGLLRETYLRERVDAKVSDSAVRDEYSRFAKANPKQTEYNARHMLVDTKDAADSLIRQVSEGGNFAKLAATHNKGPEKDKGGALGYFTAKEVVPEFAEAVEKMKVGEVSAEPIKTQFGWHVIKLENKRTREAPKFEDVKDQMRERVTQKFVQEELNKLRKDAKVEIFPDNLAQMPQAKALKGVNGETGKKVSE